MPSAAVARSVQPRIWERRCGQFCYPQRNDEGRGVGGHQRVEQGCGGEAESAAP